jgi:hypothetical protein
MKEPGLDGRHRDKAALKKGEIQQKRGGTQNHLPKPIPQFGLRTTLAAMREKTGQVWVELTLTRSTGSPRTMPR